MLTNTIQADLCKAQLLVQASKVEDLRLAMIKVPLVHGLAALDHVLDLARVLERCFSMDVSRGLELAAKEATPEMIACLVGMGFQRLSFNARTIHLYLLEKARVFSFRTPVEREELAKDAWLSLLNDLINGHE